MRAFFGLIALAIDFISWFYPFVVSIISSTLVATISLKLFPPLINIFWIAATFPLLYMLWLSTFVCVAVVINIVYFWGFQKPATLNVDLSFNTLKDLYNFLDVTRILSLYRMGLFVSRLPILNYSLIPPLAFRWVNSFVMRVYSPAVHIGQNSLVMSRSQDPDLTYIGNDTVIGAYCQLVCHTLNTYDGYLKYSSAPIHIDDGVTIGGNSRVGMGTKIGKGAVVEVNSNILPFTRIAPYEVWGGNPAKCLRQLGNANTPIPNEVALPKLEKQEEPLPTPKKQVVATLNTTRVSELDRIIAKALRIPVEQVTADLSSENCADWDSLAKMAIAAALFDQFALRLTPDEINCLNSRSSVVQLVELQPSRDSISGDEANYPIPSKLPKDPELLPLGDLETNTRLLAQHFNQDLPKADTKICIAATFTAEPLSSTLQLWCRAFGIPVEMEILGFDRVEESLLYSNSPFHANPKGVNVVLVRPEDLVSEADFEGCLKGKQIIEAIRYYAKRHPGLVVANLPPATSAFFEGTPDQVVALRHWWQSQISSIADVRMLDFASVIENLGLRQSRDTSMEIITRAPYSQRVYQQLGIAIARLVRQTFLPSKKVIALDCDNTLWGGVIGEDGLNGIALSDDHPGRSFKLFQKALLKLKQRGVLLVIVSKNEENDVWQVFDQHPDMLLKRSDIAGYRINWQAKSKNIRELAQELNLGIDAFVFVDDSPNERLEVSTNAREVTVVPMPSDSTQYVESLNCLWCFDAASVTAEDAKRTQYMLQEQQRQQLQAEEISPERYLEALQLEVDIRLADAAELSRVAQLTQKTNQFNLSLVRRSLTEIKTLPADYSIWILHVKDRFGDYGLVGVAIVKPESSQLILDTLLISCRALGRGVETAFISRLFEFAKQKGLTHVVAPFVAGPRNAQVKTFLLHAGFTSDEQDKLMAPIEAAPDSPTHIVLPAF